MTHKIRNASVAEIDCSLDILDSLRDDYADFDQWFARIREEGRRCKFIGCLARPEALAIYKAEGSSIKLCTFKVRSGYEGQGRAHDLMQALIECARESSLNSLFAEVHAHHTELQSVLRHWGFEPARIPGRTDRRWTLAI